MNRPTPRRLLRQISFSGVEQLVRWAGGRGLGVGRRFSDDALAYFTERLEPGPTREAVMQAARRAKRNKAFDNCRWIGLALDGTSAGRSRSRRCALCRPVRQAQHQVAGYRHQLAALSVLGAGLSLPLDVEPYGPGDSEYAAGQLGLRVVARLKDNLPELRAAVQQRFGSQPPTAIYRQQREWAEIWDADDFDPWENLRWNTVRVVRYRQHTPDGRLIEADWLTDWPTRQASGLSVYRMAKSHWEIENLGFNDAKNRYGLEHICHHQANSVLVNWLLTFLALVIERLYRIRHLHRGRHPVRSAAELCRLLWLSLGRRPSSLDSS